jgi:hypothetical protein
VTGGIVVTARRHPWGLYAAWAALLIWWALVAWTKPAPVVDERIHWRAAADLAAGDAREVRLLPMIPGYHALAAGVARLGGDYRVLRGLNVALVAFGAGFLYLAARRRGDADPDALVLMQVLNPAALWLFALVYTEPLSWTLLAAALWMHAARRPWLAALALLACILVRQSNLVWILLFAAWAWLEVRPLAAEAGSLTVDSHRARRFDRAALRAAGPYLVALALGLGAVIAHAAWFAVPDPHNRAGLNPATFFLCGFIAAVVWVPIWLPNLVRDWRSLYGPALRRASTCGIVLGAGTVLFLVYRNPHTWNSSPDYLHDVFVETLLRLPAARIAVIVLLLAAAAPLARFASQPRHRGHLAAAWLAAALFLAPHYLADHRYMIFPLMLLHAAARYTPAQARWLAAWSGLLAAAAAAYFLRFGAERAGL